MLIIPSKQMNALIGKWKPKVYSEKDLPAVTIQPKPWRNSWTGMPTKTKIIVINSEKIFSLAASRFNPEIA